MCPCVSFAVLSAKNNTKNNICSNDIQVVTMGYNGGRFLAPLKTLNCELCETADDEIVKPNFFKSNPARDVDEPTRRMGENDATFLERAGKQDSFKVLPLEVYQGLLSSAS